LRTANVNVARAARWSVLAELRDRIGKVLSRLAGKDDPLQHLSSASMAGDHETALERIVERAQEIAYRPYVASEHEDHQEAPDGKAQAFFELAAGKATPLNTYIERWLAGTTYTERTKADVRTALGELQRWCEDNHRPAFLERIDDRTASDFRDTAFVGKVHPKTANKKLSALRQYWTWLDRSFGIKPNPWRDKSLPKPKAHLQDPDGPNGRERPFTDDELERLLSGHADADLRDLMLIAALSGMRLEEIGQLRVGDCGGGVFNVRKGKTAAAVRTVPIHPKLGSVVKRRTANRAPLEYLFEAFQDTGWDGNRTMAASKRFATYRRRVGVDDHREGARRSKVNFHSFRRWFARQCEEARGITDNVTEAVMGQQKGGMAYGVYSQAELVELKRRCVLSVKLPTAPQRKNTDKHTARRNVSAENRTLKSAGLD
jgi:integrase